MNSSTLRGVFPEPKPVYKRNFVKENVKRIKQIQGVVQNQPGMDNRPMKTISQINAETKKSGFILEQALSQSRSLKEPKPHKVVKRKPFSVNEKAKGDTITSKNQIKISELPLHSLTHRGVQTERPEEISKLYATGIIKVPSPAVLQNIARNKSPVRQQTTSTSKRDRGDTTDFGDSHSPSRDVNERLTSLDLNDEHNYIKENIKAIKHRNAKQDASPEEQKRSYQVGVLPKYLRERKEQKEAEVDTECPDGHVLLPEEERKETLRVLRQSYADRIQELNSMPVRSDTLRMRNRKMAIEEELKKIDEGIKVFQRPKVFVKINA